MSDLTRDLLFLLARLAEAGGERRSLAEVAAFDGRSTFHVQRLFKQAVGETPLQYQKRVQLQRAAATLLVTELRVVDVALRAGFESHEGFSRAFRTRFGVSPTKFRERRAEFDSLLDHHRTHLEVALSAAPCVGLYRTPLNPGDTARGPRMTYEIVIKDLPQTPFLFMREQCEHDPAKIAQAMGGALGAVFQHATQQGLPFAGPPTTRYPSFGPGLLTFEAGLPLATEAESAGAILAGHLQGGPAATTVHEGAYDSLDQAHAAVQRWLAAEKREAAGPPWEVYMTDPGECPNPADWRTEIVWPLKA